MPFRRFRLLLVVAAVLAFAGSSAAYLHFGRAHASDDEYAGKFDPYLHRPDGGTLADPINLIFRGGDAATVAAVVQQVLGWQPVQGGGMTFIDGGQARPTAYQFGLDLGWGNRLHLRIETVTKTNAQTYVLAGVHRDDMTGCGHVGGAFNAARATVVRAFVAQDYAVTRIHLKNTEPGPQCNGSMTAGDGNAVVIDLGSSTPPAQSPLLPAGKLLPPINFGK